MLEVIYWDLGKKLTFVRFMTAMVIQGIQHDISRNLTRTISSWKVSTTRHFTLKMWIYDLLLDSIWSLLVEQQQRSLTFELLVQTSLSPQDPPTSQASLMTKTSYEPIKFSMIIERAYSQLWHLPIHCINLMLSAAWGSSVGIIWTIPQWRSIQ